MEEKTLPAKDPVSTGPANADLLLRPHDDLSTDRRTASTRRCRQGRPDGTWHETKDLGGGSPEEEAAWLEEVSVQYQVTVRRDGVAEAGKALSSLAETGNGPAQFLREVHKFNPAAADRLSRAVTSFPQVGQEFLGFRLVGVLGRGAFGKVYLAEQGDLANRPVALKIAADIRGESQTLAQLQHTNIVPLYSYHRADPFHAVCMPYFGATTLADILRNLDGGKSLPDSGKKLISTLNDHQAETRPAPDSSMWRVPEWLLQEHPGVPEPVPARPASKAAFAREMFEALTYVDSVLWMFTRLADGLANAHDRGILHQDLKPANILLTDDGVPMLLDFNLSEDTKLRGGAVAATIGGTLPYMAPEHLEAFRNGSSRLDGRSDVYSLGVILFELLTGQPPFPRYRGSSSEKTQEMITDRRRILPRPRLLNPAVSPAVESIVQQCLKADPAQRYQSAGEFREDLDRHLHNRALKFAPEPSLRERIGKWGRRHPRLASTSTIGCLAVALLIGLGSGIVLRDRRLARFDAAQTFQTFQDRVRTAEFKLLRRHTDGNQLAEGIDECRGALDLYHMIDNRHWRESPGVRNLPPEDRQQLETEAGQLLFLLAKATSLDAQVYTRRRRGKNDSRMPWTSTC